MKYKIPVFLLLFILLSLCWFKDFVFAQNIVAGVAQQYLIEGGAEDGDIISIKDGKYIKARVKYDSAVLGVVSSSAAITIEKRVPDKNTHPVVNSGLVKVKVSTINGDIKKGDILTTSEIPGVAMKATEEGFSIGLAQEDYNNSNKSAVKLIDISLRVQYVYDETGASSITPKNIILDSFNISSLKRYDTMAEVLKLGFAVLLVITTFGYGFVTFRKIATRAVEATGRNPLASKIIIFNLIVNILVTSIIIASGLALAYFILSL